MIEKIVTIQLRFRGADPDAIAQAVGPVVRAALAAGGVGTTVSMQDHEPDDGDRSSQERP